ncbi:MAG: hypothetical protein QM703_03370 [Gemmatales bacterium]
MSITTSLMEKAKLLPEWQQRRLLEIATQFEYETSSTPANDHDIKDRSDRFHRELGRFANQGLTVSWETCRQARREAWGKWSEDQE